MDTVKISVVMATFNRSRMLPRMVDSILNQTFKEFELLIINNGSTDNTEAVCTIFLSKESRIRYYSILENNGPAAARNLGIENARAKYILFLDDDDYCEPNMFYHLYGLIDKYNADIAITGCVDEYQNEIIPKYSFEKEYLWDKTEAVSEFLKREKFHTAPATKLFKKSLFKDIKFISGVRVDDIHVIYKLFVQANKVVAQGLPTYRFYKHSQNMTSFIHTDCIAKDILDDYLKMQNERVNYISQHVPELASQVRYAKWSYMISMVDKILSGHGDNCDPLLILMLEDLRKNQDEFITSDWITEREIQLMNKYVL